MMRIADLPKTFNGWVQARTLHVPGGVAVPSAIATCKRHVAIHCSSDVQGLFGACHRAIISIGIGGLQTGTASSPAPMQTASKDSVYI